MSKSRLISISFLVIGLGLMTLWDIYPALTPQLGDTISEVIRDYSQSIWTVPYVCGILMGHFFLTGDDQSTRNIPLLWVTVVLTSIRDCFQVLVFPGGTPIIFFLGFLAGGYWWRQTRKTTFNVGRHN